MTPEMTKKLQHLCMVCFLILKTSFAVKRKGRLCALLEDKSDIFYCRCCWLQMGMFVLSSVTEAVGEQVKIILKV